MILFWKMTIIKHLYAHSVTSNPPNTAGGTRIAGRDSNPKWRFWSSSVRSRSPRRCHLFDHEPVVGARSRLDGRNSRRPPAHRIDADVLWRYESSRIRNPA